ncbi:uncharacterized protein LOC128553818 [Mercenaria mercenaria]|uniref:uncharacterized protein LOC128553818 n=1 Tax=Mercenaria mercenaria TaxID=6596 RepID=UPI00234E6D47|nr:uncharacterized protein LOC128553818 [Mercenaria mercenaria]
MYQVKHKPLEKSNVYFGDIPGLQDKGGITKEDILFILDGHVPNNYQIINGIQENSKGFVLHPQNSDKIHCVCFVFDCESITKGLSEKHQETTRSVMADVDGKGMKFIVILTKCDKVSERVRDDTSQIFEDKCVRECKDKLMAMFSLRSQAMIYPVVNYVDAADVDLQVDSLIIVAFEQILKFGKDFLETAEDKWSEIPDSESMTSAVTGNDKRSLQLYTVPISCWPDVNQSKIRIRNMLNYCKSIEKNVGLKSEEEGANIDNVDIYIDADVIEIESLLSGNTTFEKKNVQVLTISEATGKEHLTNFKGVVIDSGGVKIIRSLLGSNATVNKTDDYLNDRDCDKTYKETIRTETKYIIESVVFEPLIQKCEFLGRVIDTLNAASINKVSQTSHDGERDQMSRNKSARPKVSGKLDYTYQEEQEDIDKYFDEKTLEQFNQQRDAVEDLYEEMVASISRSHLEEYDLTRLQDSRQSRYDSKEISQELFQREKSVKGCGFRLKSFHVDIEELPTKEEHNDRERRIRDFLCARNINNVKFNFVSPKLAKYSYVGAKVGFKCGSIMQTGTLGCFAKHSRCNKSDLCALFSKHVAQGCSEKILIRDEDQQFTTFGTLLSDTFVDGGHDIAAAKVNSNHLSSCDMGFKNDEGEKAPGELYNIGDTTNLQGHPIHLWGAKSKPGIGKITVQHYHFAQDTDTFIEVQDGCIALGKADAVLAERGDSGAIVCMNESNGEKVKIISMLIGSTNETVSQEDPKVKRKYLTLPLSSGLQTLENRTHGKFQLEGAESSGTNCQPAQN